MPEYKIPIFIKVIADSLPDAISHAGDALLGEELAYLINGCAIPNAISEEDTAREISVGRNTDYSVLEASGILVDPDQIELSLSLRNYKSGTLITKTLMIQIDPCIDLDEYADSLSVLNVGKSSPRYDSVMITIEGKDDDGNELIAEMQVNVSKIDGEISEKSLVWNLMKSEEDEDE